MSACRKLNFEEKKLKWYMCNKNYTYDILQEREITCVSLDDKRICCFECTFHWLSSIYNKYVCVICDRE